MKKNNIYLVVVLISLITVILIAGIVLITTVFSASNDPVTNDQTSLTATPVETPKSTTDILVLFPSYTTPAPLTTSGPETTAPTPATTPQTPAETTPQTPAETTPAPETSAVPLKPISGSVTGEAVGSLGIYASYVTETVDSEAGTITVRVSFYVESYGLQVGARTTNYLLVDGKKISNVHTERINLPDGSPQTRTVLYEYVATLEKSDDTPVTLELEYFWNCKLYYSGEYVDYLSVKVDLTV